MITKIPKFQKDVVKFSIMCKLALPCNNKKKHSMSSNLYETAGSSDRSKVCIAKMKILETLLKGRALANNMDIFS